MTLAAVTFFVVLLGYAWAFQPGVSGQPEFLLRFAAPHVALTILALYELKKRGLLAARLEPRWGDLSVGVVTAALLLMSALGARSFLATPGTPRQAWLLMLYAQLGDPEAIQRSIALTLLLLGIAVAEEIVWRGMMLTLLTERFGPRRGWILCALLYALAALPTVFTLGVAPAGQNPLLVMAALGCGIVWTFLAVRLGRLVPGMVSHMAFTYFAVLQFRLPM